jgi:hypothetical protein
VIGLLDVSLHDTSLYANADQVPDPSCVLFYPSSSPLSSLDAGILSKLISSLVIRFKSNVDGSLPAKAVRRLIQPEVREWTKLRILPAGDTIRAAGDGSAGGLDAEDRRDNTVVRVGFLFRFHGQLTLTRL